VAKWLRERESGPDRRTNFDKREIKAKCREDRDISHATLNQTQGIAEPVGQQQTGKVMVEIPLISCIFFFQLFVGNCHIDNLLAKTQREWKKKGGKASV